MKKFSKLFGIIASFALIALVACDDGKTDDGTTGETTEYNKFTINGVTYEVRAGDGYMTFYGDYYESNAINVDLFIDFGNAEMYLELFVPNGNDRLIAGTYNNSQNHTQFTYSGGEIWIEENDIWYEITGGTVKVSISGTGTNAIYTIEINCTLKDEEGNNSGILNGTYRGTLDWEEDQTPDFSITITNNSNTTITGIIIGDHTGGANPYVPHYQRIPVNIAPMQTSEVLDLFSFGPRYGGGYYQFSIYVRTENGSWDVLNDFEYNCIFSHTHTMEPPPSFIALSFPIE